MKDNEDFRFRGIKQMRQKNYVDIYEAVLEWFKIVRAKKIPVIGPMVQHEAKELADALKIKNFPPAMGGCTDFAYRIISPFDHYVVKWLMSISVYVKIGRSVFHCRWLNMITRHIQHEEMALFFRALPNMSMNQKFEEARSGKIPKERPTSSFCVSAA